MLSERSSTKHATLYKTCSTQNVSRALCNISDSNSVHHNTWWGSACGVERSTQSVTHQLDDLDEDPVVGGGGHELEEQWGQRQVVLGVPPGQLTDHVHRCRLDT